MEERELDIIENISEKNSDAEKVEISSLPVEDTEKEPSKSREKSKGFTYDPYMESNWFSKLFLIWSFKTLCVGRKERIELPYLGTLNKENDANYFSNDIAYYWNKKNYKEKSYGLFRAVIASNFSRIIKVVFLAYVEYTSQYLSTILIKDFIDNFSTKEKKNTIAIFSSFSLKSKAVLLILFELIYTFCKCHIYIKEGVISERGEIEMECFIYKKILTASPSSFEEKATQGEILNFIKVDSSKIYFLLLSIKEYFVLPIFTMAYIYLIFQFFGISFLFGFILMIFLMILAGKMFKKMGIIEDEIMQKKDDRMKVTTETFENLKLLKIYNWENIFKKKILDKREVEIQTNRKLLKLMLFGNWMYSFCPVIVIVLTFVLYGYFSEVFDIGKILVGIAVFGRLQEIVYSIPYAVTTFIEASISFRRIEKFIKQPDRNEKNIINIQDEKNDIAISIKEASFTWGKPQKENEDEDESEPKENEKTLSKEELEKPLIEVKSDKEDKDYEIVLKDISFEVKKGEIIGIIGEVGSGKSTLFQVLLNNLILLNPNETSGIYVNGKIGYSSQQPWIQNATIRDNILFFNEYDEKKYQEVIEMTQLSDDLKMLDGGDQTEIGEKGVNLSGGQKVRVAIARLLYSNPDIYLFDDPLSALDANVGAKIMKNCIIKHLKGKTRLIITNAMYSLQFMDRIYYLKKGKIEWSGNFNDLLKQDFYNDLKKKEIEHENKEEEMKEEEKKEKEEKKESKLVRITEDEERETGRVKFDYYVKYFTYMGGVWFIVKGIIYMVLWQLTKAGSDLWIASWSKNEKDKPSFADKARFFSIYSILCLTYTLLELAVFFLFGEGTLRLDLNLHKDMITRLIKAPINLFHEKIPKGQIYTRLSEDLENLEFVMYKVMELFLGGFHCFGAIIICGLYDPYSLCFVPLFTVIGYYITKFYFPGSMEISRLWKITNSPITNGITESIPGATTILSFNKEKEYKKIVFDRMNNYLKASIFHYGTETWFAMQFEFLCVLYLTYLIISIILFEKSYTVESVGLMLGYSIILQEKLGYFFKQFPRLENSMVSMERVSKYLTIVQEKGAPLKKNETLKSWPSTGKIEFKNYSVKYRPNTPIILNNINCIINGGEKVGVVGRTGSGKSTICLSLFRILEPHLGKIFIDDVDITSIDLNLLRGKIAFIPQDPCLFSGTLKYNIDPIKQYSDKEINDVVIGVGLETSILNKVLEPNGNNLSVGEKQLVCIARAVLRKTKIVVLDEATANIDINTEKKIQELITKRFENSTMIIIAHRIKTILSTDKVLVLDKGEIKEFDYTKKLMNDKDSLFYQLYSKSEL